MRNIFNLTAIAAFLQHGFTFYAVEQAPDVVDSTHPDNISGDKPEEAGAAGIDHKAVGRATAREIIEKQAEGEIFARAKLLEAAKTYAGMPSAADWLEGFGEGYNTDKDNGVRKARVSEARAIFDAWVQPISGTVDEAREKLETFKGSYQDFVALARDTRGKRGGGRKAGSTKVNATPADVKKVNETLPLMNLSQGLDVAKKATVLLSKAPNGEVILMRQLTSDDGALSILARSEDEGIKNAASSAKGRFMEILKAHDEAEAKKKAEAAAQQAGATTTLPQGAEGQLETPKPAEAEAGQQQVVNQ